MAQPNIDTTGEEERMSDSSRQRIEQENADQRARQRWTETEERSDARAAPRPEGQAGQDVWQQWWQIQANFVDDPHNAVAEAHHLVTEQVQQLMRRYEDENKQLEARWSSGGETSTEDLRCALQSYKEFFGRLAAR